MLPNGARLWAEIALVVLALVAVVQWRESVAANAILSEKLKQNAAVLRSAEGAHVVAKSHTDTVTKAVSHWLTLHESDTLWRHDTVVVNGEPRVAVPIPTIARWDSTANACRDLVTSCATERAAAKTLIAAYAERVALMEKAAPNPWAPHLGIGGAVGVGPDGKPALLFGVTYGWTLR